MKKILFLTFLFPSLSFSDVRIAHPPLQINDNGTISYGYFYLLTITGSDTLTNNHDGTLQLVCAGVATKDLLLEDATYIILEDASKLVLE